MPIFCFYTNHCRLCENQGEVIFDHKIYFYGLNINATIEKQQASFDSYDILSENV